jgi:hypothetical protein
MAAWSEERKLKAKEAYKERVESIQEIVLEPTTEAKIFDKNLLQKVEVYNNEEVPEYRERNNLENWNEDDKISSIVNTITFLPSNMLKDGRHKIENVQAINCFRVTQDLMDKAYANYEHDDFGQLVKRK